MREENIKRAEQIIGSSLLDDLIDNGLIILDKDELERMIKELDNKQQENKELKRLIFKQNLKLATWRMFGKSSGH